MADNIMGPEVNLGLNVDLNLDSSAQDASTLASQIKEMRMDQEAFRDVIADTQERIREITTEYQEQLSLRQQMLDAEESLKNLSESRTQSLKDQTNAYRDMEQTMGRLGQTMAMGGGYGGGGYGGGGYGMGGYGGGGYGMGGYGGGMSGFYNPMSGSMMGMSGFPSAFSENPAETASIEDEINESEKDKGAVDKVRQTAQDMFYFGGIPKELKELIGNPAVLQIAKGFSPGLAARLSNVGKGGLSALTVGTSLEGVSGLLGPAAGAYLGYKSISDYLQTGQEYGALTGQTGQGATLNGYTADAQAFFGSFLNPLMPYGVSKQIESTGLAAGYGDPNSSLFNQYRSFASGAFENYQISPGESQSMFQNAVVLAGSSLGNLSSALDNTAQMALKSGTSFQEAVQNFSSLISSNANYGIKGSAVTNGASELNNAFNGMGKAEAQRMQGVGAELGSWGTTTLTGQALLSQTAGVPIDNLNNFLTNNPTAQGPLTIEALQKLLQGSKNDPWRATQILQTTGLNLNLNQVQGLLQGLYSNPGAVARSMSMGIAKPELKNYQHSSTAAGGAWAHAASATSFNLPHIDTNLPGGWLNPINDTNAGLNSLLGVAGAVSGAASDWVNHQMNSGGSMQWGGNAGGQSAYQKAMKEYNSQQNQYNNLSINLTVHPSNLAKAISVSASNNSADTGVSNRNSSNGSTGVSATNN